MNPTIFHQSWWLDIVSQDNWALAEVQENGQTIASMPYTFRHRFGFTFIEMPPLTQVLGPSEPTYSGKYTSRLARQKDIYCGLVSALPRYDLFRQSFHPGVTNWLPFYWLGFAQTTRYTYRLDLTQTLDELWAGTQNNIRTDIRKAERVLSLREESDPDFFMSVVVKTFDRQNMRLPYDVSIIRRLFERGPCYSRMRVLSAVDSLGEVHGVSLFLGDENCVYYLMGGADPLLRNSGCQSLMLWDGIKWASTFSRFFDFEGSMIEGVERFVRGFGAQQQPYFQLTAMSRRMSVLWHGAAMLGGVVGKPVSIFSL